LLISNCVAHTDRCRAVTGGDDQLGPASQDRAAKWEPARTPWGDPDLQGIWNNVTATPLQRPDDLKDKALLTMRKPLNTRGAARR
jgi:hypothetical protein